LNEFKKLKRAQRTPFYSISLTEQKDKLSFMIVLKRVKENPEFEMMGIHKAEPNGLFLNIRKSP
jgi:hypothetical protein